MERRFKKTEYTEQQVKDFVAETLKRKNVTGCSYRSDGDYWVVTIEEHL